MIAAVIEHHEHVTVADEARDRLYGGAAHLVGEAERSCHRDRHDAGIGDRRQIDIPRPIAELGCDPGRDLHSQPGLAHAARACQGHQTVVGQDLPDVVDLRATADEIRELYRKMPHCKVFGHP